MYIPLYTHKKTPLFSFNTECMTITRLNLFHFLCYPRYLDVVTTLGYKCTASNTRVGPDIRPVVLGLARISGNQPEEIF